MALRASVAVVVGCRYADAARLLAAADVGAAPDVAEVLAAHPALAAFTGFGSSSAPLHRAAASGHLDVCRAVVAALRARAEAAEARARGAGPLRALRPGGGARRWRALLAAVLAQRNRRGLTPLLLAAERGHAGVVRFLLDAGADPLATDAVQRRNALHFAAAGAHVDVLRLLCSDAARAPAPAPPRGARRGRAGSPPPRGPPLREAIVPDIQVGTARFVDARAYGGLTPLHFGAVTGRVDAVQALLSAGASTMARTDGEAFIGADFLVPGSTPLHVAAIVGSLAVAAALLSAHVGLMSVAGAGWDARGRRAWEAHSRTDVRSARNADRRLPYHLARERGAPALMQLVDPRVPAEAALDAARDTAAGIGPKRLSTLAALALQRGLLGWLDAEGAARAAAERDRRAAAAAARRERRERRRARAAAAAAAAAPPAPGAGGAALASITVVARSPARPPPAPPRHSRGGSGAAAPAQSPAQSPGDVVESAFAAAARMRRTSLDRVSAASDAPAPPPAGAAGGSEPGTPRRSLAAASLPATPAPAAPAAGAAAPASAPAAPALAAAAAAAARADSVRAYVGLLSVRRASAEPAPSGARPAGVPRAASLTLRAGGAEGSGRRPQRHHARSATAPDLPAPLDGGGGAISLAPPGGGREPGGSVRRALLSAARMLSLEAPAAAGSPSPPVAKADDVDDGCADSGSEAGSAAGGGGSSAADAECGVCLDRGVEVAFAGCAHALCLECARRLTAAAAKPPTCPFCRATVFAFRGVACA